MNSVLDTSVVSQATKQRPEELSFAWMQRTRVSEMYLSVVTLMELRAGIERLHHGEKRTRFELWLALDLQRHYAGRLLPVSAEIADDAGRLLARSRVRAEKVGIQGVLIAATARVYGYKVATLNRKHFLLLDVPLVDF